MATNYSLLISPQAEKDFDSIFTYIYSELCNPSAAQNQIDDFENALQTVCVMPNSCPLVNNEYVKDKTLHKLIVNNYIVFYRIKNENQTIEVVRVLYGMMNFKEVL